MTGAALPRVAVIGATGVVGGAVLEALRHAGRSPIGCHRLPSPPIRWANVPSYRLDLESQTAAPPGVAELLSTGPLDRFTAWLQRVQPVGLQRIVALSSMSLVTKRGSEDSGERDLAARLAASEARLMALSAELGIQTTMLRPTLIYGSGRDRTLDRIAALSRRWGFFVLPRRAIGLRQPVHVADVAAAMVAALDRPATSGRVFGLGGAERLPYHDMVRRVMAAASPRARLLTVPDRGFDGILGVAHRIGALGSLSGAAAWRMADDLIVDNAPVCAALGIKPRDFQPERSGRGGSVG